MLHLLRVFFQLFFRVRKQAVTHYTNRWLVVEQTVTHCINLWLTVGSRRDFFLVKLEDGSFNVCWLFVLNPSFTATHRQSWLHAQYHIHEHEMISGLLLCSRSLAPFFRPIHTPA